MSIVTKFYNNINNFLDDIMKIYPDYTNKIKLVKEKLSLLPNKKIIIDNFVLHALPHRNEIMNKDEHFFLNLYNEKGNEAIDNMDEDDQISKNFLKSLNVLELRDQLTSQNKEVIWTYLRVFCVLAERYIVEQTSK